ncbi:hypothetical protein K438DRAFT_1748262 [Mycena galopus ATCC 62051]|nr:hypothetical protein K438DRAFT_1748262 [Mycena galopus ATCC 62051]
MGSKLHSAAIPGQEDFYCPELPHSVAQAAWERRTTDDGRPMVAVIIWPFWTVSVRQPLGNRNHNGLLCEPVLRYALILGWRNCQPASDNQHNRLFRTSWLSYLLALLTSLGPSRRHGECEYESQDLELATPVKWGAVGRKQITDTGVTCSHPRYPFDHAANIARPVCIALRSPAGSLDKPTDVSNTRFGQTTPSLLF